MHPTHLLTSALTALALSSPAAAQVWAESQQLPGLDFQPPVAASGSLLAAGNPSSNATPGRALVYELGTLGWEVTATLLDPSGQVGTNYAESLALEGDTLAVGAWAETAGGLGVAGAVYVYVQSGGAWNLEQRLEAQSPVLGGAFGQRLALSGDTLAISSWPGVVNGGERVQIYTRSAGVWSWQAEIANADFEDPLALWGNTLVIGEPGAEAGAGFTNAGKVRVFVRAGTTWSLEQTLKAGNKQAQAAFGNAISLQGDELVVGAYLHDQPGAADAGAAYVFRRSGTVWSEVAALSAFDAAAGDELGTQVSLLGDQIAVGVPKDDLTGVVTTNAGSVRVFVRTGASWWESGLLTTANAFDFQGFGLDVAQTEGLIAASTGSDAAYVFEGGARVEGFCVAGTSASGCQALIAPSGTPSASAPSGFALDVNGLEGQKQGLCFFGTSGPASLPWGNGTSVRCTANPVKRGALLASGGTLGACDGAFSYDLNARWTQQPNQNPGAGAEVQAQFWYRDPFNTSNQTTSLSDAVNFYVMP